MPRDVHDRENAGLLIVSFLFDLVVREQTRHTCIASDKRLDQIRMKNRIEFPFRQHGLDRFVVGET